MNQTDRTQIETTREKFKRLYRESLAEAVAKYPEEYGWPVENVPIVADRMLKAVANGMFNHDGKGFKILAKKLGIKPTRTAILAAWNA